MVLLYIPGSPLATHDTYEEAIGNLPTSVMAKTSLASQPYFSVYAHARAKMGGGREGKIRLGRAHPVPRGGTTTSRPRAMRAGRPSFNCMFYIPRLLYVSRETLMHM